MNIYIRSSRRWMKNLARTMNWFYLDSPSSQMSDLHNMTLKEKILHLLKRSSLPPLEWFISYEKIVSVPDDTDLIIEPGSRLINTKKDYVSYCENGLGILSYNPKKINFLNKFIAKKLVNRKNFKGFVFYSNSARVAAYSIFGVDFFKGKDLGVIYPFANFDSDLVIVERSRHSSITSNPSSTIKFGFCSSLFLLKGGREIVDAFCDLVKLNKLQSVSLELVLVTRASDIPTLYKEKINGNKNIHIVEFDLSQSEFLNLSRSWSWYLHCSYFDSCPLSIIEMKQLGIKIIATDNFAIPELLQTDDGDLTIPEPKNFFNKSTFLPNNNIFIDDFIVENSGQNAVYEKELYNNILESFIRVINEYDSKVSIVKSEYHLSSRRIVEDWNRLIYSIIK